jgi:phosphonate degradation associated HDIG domain protein
MTLCLSDIERLLATRGAAQYGNEAVSQLEHALQCAALAEQADAPDTLIAACLLHDIGHLIAAEQCHQTDDTQDTDDLHQYVGLPFLRHLLPDAVLDPIRLHVDAKRYLCHADPGYWAQLSPASRHSLELQGGRFDADAAANFVKQAHALDAVQLRRFDDLAKVPGLGTPPLSHYLLKLSSLTNPTSR